MKLSRPNFFRNPEDAARRRDVIRAAYEAARAAGEENVYFIDGEDLLAGPCASNCTVDGIHPNDAGFQRMVRAIQPVLDTLLTAGNR